MDVKILIALLIAINCYSSCGAALRRTPKIYNALITTDENLTSSRAYPVIQPTIHESGVAHYPFGPYNPYGFYSPPLVRFGQPIVPGLAPNRQFPYPLPQQRFPPQIMQQPLPIAEPQLAPPSAAPATAVAAPQTPPLVGSADKTISPTAVSLTEEQQPVKPPAQPASLPNLAYMPPIDQNPPQPMPNEKLPISLNEFGLPPSLIPLQQYPNHNHAGPVPLLPYGFNQYPLVYDPITGYREQYLPPYEYYPSPHQPFTLSSGANVAPKPPSPATPTAVTSAPTSPTPAQASVEKTAASEAVPQPIYPEPASDFDSIKNASKNKNNEVPDVPPPPIPSGAKVQQS